MLLTVALLALLGASSLFGQIEIGDQTYEVGKAIEPVVLPAAPEGLGTPPLTYSLSPELPAGLTFDPATRTLSGTPTAAAAATDYTYTVTDVNGSSAPWPTPISIEVQTPPPIELADAYVYEVGKAIEPVLFPAAPEGLGTPPLTYSLSPLLPAGLTFDSATRTLSGTPTAAAAATSYTYTVTDVNGSSAPWPTPINIEVQAPPPIELVAAHLYEVGKAIEPVVFPAAPIGLGTPPLTYSLSPELPAGLTFDSATRTLSGTPTAAAAATDYIYTVTDVNGSSGSWPAPINIEVVPPPIDAPDELIAEDYKGADGAGDQGGFIMLTWDLSDDHASLDGYRIFREVQVTTVIGEDGGLVTLDEPRAEMIPWAMVDAVPDEQVGRAIVATLDNASAIWGIAAEADGRSSTATRAAAKAAFVQATDLNQPYALMAETLMASREAAQAGDAPVFASLLPEALAYAQGVAPRLNVVEGVLARSAITLTEEPVRAIDNLAPLAVPSLIVLDAPNDEGSRIALTWTLSPSDRLLQGVVAEAIGSIGPTPAESVAGVHGYSIYRKTGAEGEFAMIAQVDAGITSFVDETALNGVRYTYQVRPYDLDNETGSDIEQTAMAVRNVVVDSEGRAILGLFGADNRVGFDDFFILADLFGLTEEDAGFDPAFDLAPSAMIDFDDFFVFADNFGRSTAAAGKRVPMLAGLNADARMYLDARTGMPIVGEDFILDVRVADFVAVKGYGLQVQYDASQLEFVRALTDQPLGGSEFATPQVLANQAGVLTVAAHGDIVSDGEVALSLVFRPTTEIEDTVIEIIDNQTYDSEFGFNRLALPAPVQLQTRPEAFALANNYPNPFNPATTIKYALPQAADVELTVYNVIGQPVRTLVAEHQNAGRYVVEWDATNDSGHSLSSGMYFYRLQAGGEFLETKKMLLLK